MQAEEIVKHLARSGFQRAVVNGPYVDVLIQARNAKAYVVVVVDCDNLPDIAATDYENMLRGVRSSVYQYQFEEVKELGVLCTNEPDKVKNFVSVFGEHWVVDLSERRLLVYENQIENFLNAREVIEEVLLYDNLAEVAKEEKEKKNFLKDNICSLLLVLINVLVFIWVELHGSSENPDYMIQCGAMLPREVGHGFWQYRLFTSMFLHFGIDHLVNNMFVLLVMGHYLEKYVGKGKYLFIYIGAGIIGNLASLYMSIQHHMLDVVSAGASGAIFGVTGAIVCILLKNRGRLEDLTLQQIIIMVALNVYNGMVSQGIDQAAHIGGLIGGFLLTAVLYWRKDKEEHFS